MPSAILRKTISNSRENLFRHAKKTVPGKPAASQATASPPASLSDFLTENASAIFALWRDRLTKVSHGQNPPDPEILKSVLAQFAILLQSDSPNKRTSISDKNVAAALRITSDLNLALLTPGLDPLHLYLVCGESLQAFARSSDAAKNLPQAERKLLLLKIDAAFSILIHHQIHAFSRQSCSA